MSRWVSSRTASPLWLASFWQLASLVEQANLILSVPDVSTSPFFLGFMSKLTGAPQTIDQILVVACRESSLLFFDPANDVDLPLSDDPPFRVPVEAGMRRLRLSDFVSVFGWSGARPATRWGAVPAANFVGYSALTLRRGEQWIARWSRAGLFSLTMLQAEAAVKRASDLLKNQRVWVQGAEMYTECVGLFGYKVLPWAGWDLDAEVRSLAGENPIEFSAPQGTFQEAFERQLSSYNTWVPAVPVTLAEWIFEGRWATDGAADIGSFVLTVRIRGLPERENITLTATKAQVRQAMESQQIQELADRMLEGAPRQCWPITKSEPGKIRLAVKAALGWYLIDSWLLSGPRIDYAHYPYVTLEQTVPEARKQMTEMFSQPYHLNIDAARFDHQPRTDHLRAIIRWLFPPSPAREAVERSYLNEWLQSPVANVRFRSGLASGDRFTSIFGNVWNATVMALILRWSAVRARIFVRGDDVDVSGSSFWPLLWFRSVLAASGYLANDAKFGLHRGWTEMLREVYRASHLQGYPARAMVSATQRKPWGADNRDAVGAADDGILALRRVGRRLGIAPSWEADFARVLSLQLSIPLPAFHAPTHAGGLGWLPLSPYSVRRVKPVIGCSTEASLWLRAAEPSCRWASAWGMTLVERGEFTARRAAAKLDSWAASRWRGASRLITESWRRCRVIPRTVVAPGGQGVEGFGSGVRFAAKWAEAREVGRMRSWSMRKTLSLVPSLIPMVRATRLELFSALDWLFGKLPCRPFWVAEEAYGTIGDIPTVRSTRVAFDWFWWWGRLEVSPWLVPSDWRMQMWSRA